MNPKCLITGTMICRELESITKSSGFTYAENQTGISVFKKDQLFMQVPYAWLLLSLDDLRDKLLAFKPFTA